MEKIEFQRLIGRRIKEIRLEKDVPQQRIASECDFEKGNMARIEAGRSNITIGTLNKVCIALEITHYYFFDHPDFMNI
jgi:transcriptional regulator with XRE-family HTH domain